VVGLRFEKGSSGFCIGSPAGFSCFGFFGLSSLSVSPSLYTTMLIHVDTKGCRHSGGTCVEAFNKAHPIIRLFLSNFGCNEC